MSGKWSGGKGDRARRIDRKKWDENYKRIFGKKKQQPPRKDSNDRDSTT